MLQAGGYEVLVIVGGSVKAGEAELIVAAMGVYAVFGSSDTQFLEIFSADAFGRPTAVVALFKTLFQRECVYCTAGRIAIGIESEGDTAVIGTGEMNVGDSERRIGGAVTKIGVGVGADMEGMSAGNSQGGLRNSAVDSVNVAVGTEEP